MPEPALAACRTAPAWARLDAGAVARCRVGGFRLDATGGGDVRLIYVLFDSLYRHALGPYGGTGVPTPNIDRMAARGLTFDNHYVGSLPCMPARRDMHTGRLNFLHRAWGPLEPFDNFFPELLRGVGAYSHLVTDHYHYFEDGGIGYHGRYSS